MPYYSLTLLAVPIFAASVRENVEDIQEEVFEALDHNQGR